MTRMGNCRWRRIRFVGRAVGGHAFLFLAVLSLALLYGAAALPASAARRGLVSILGVLTLPMYPMWIAATALTHFLAPNLPVQHGWLAVTAGVVWVALGLLPYMALDWLLRRRRSARGDSGARKGSPAANG